MTAFEHKILIAAHNTISQRKHGQVSYILFSSIFDGIVKFCAEMIDFDWQTSFHDPMLNQQMLNQSNI